MTRVFWVEWLLLITTKQSIELVLVVQLPEFSGLNGYSEF